MERLSRTRKYADLRNELNTNNERDTQSKELGQYQTRLQNITNDNVNPFNTPDQNEEFNIPTSPSLDKLMQEANKVMSENISEEDLFADLNKSIEETKEPTIFDLPDITPSYETPVTPVTPVYNEPVKSEVDNQDELLSIFDDVFNAEDKQVDSSIFETPSYNQKPVLEETGFVENHIEKQTPVIEETSYVENHINEPVIDSQVEDIFGSLIDDPVNKDITDTQVNSYINNITKEADDYNKQKGLQTLDSIAPNLINEVRGNEAKVDNEEAPVFEHPVKAVKEEEVDIPTLTELEHTMTIQKTISFDVNEEEEEEDYSDTPNKILNILLIVLIAALVLVLGFVIYEVFSANIL